MGVASTQRKNKELLRREYSSRHSGVHTTSTGYSLLVAALHTVSLEASVPVPSCSEVIISRSEE
jgi:hypothetical protein